MKREEIMHAILNSTSGIYMILKPYYRRGTISEQHWKDVLGFLNRAETVCKERCEDESERATE